jgi:hypothetical protein
MIQKNSLQDKKKYTVAWFKLADFISRKEKERALGLYRLLMHSISDKALALQLKGDILYALADTSYVQAYQQAATHYERDNKLFYAATLYDHIKSYDISDYTYAYKSFNAYKSLFLKDRMVSSAQYIIYICLQLHNDTKLYSFLRDILSLYNTMIMHSDICSLYEYMYTCCDHSDQRHKKMLRESARICVEHYMYSDSSDIDTFLSFVKDLDISIYEYIDSYIHNI